MNSGQPACEPQPMLAPDTGDQRSFYAQILRHSSIYGIGVLVQKMGSIVMLPIYTRYLSPSDYGLIELLDLSITVFGMIFGSQMSAALFYHYFEAETPKARGTVVTTTMLGSAVLGALGGGLGILLAGRVSVLVFHTPAYAAYLRILFFQFLFSLPLESCFCWLKAINRTDLFVLLSILRLILSAALNTMFLVGLRLGVSGFLMGSLISTAVLAISMVCLCLYRTPLAFDFIIFKRLCRYSMALSIGGAALFIMNFADRFFLQRFTTLADIGLYSLAYKLAMLVSYLHSSFNTYWSAQMYALAQQKSYSMYFSRVFTYLFLTLSTASVVISMSSGIALHILTTPAFFAARRLVPILVLAYFLRALGDYFRCVLYIENQPGRDAQLNWLGAGLCLLGYAVLIPGLKVWGAAIATVFAFALVAVVGFLWARRLRPFVLEWRRLAAIVSAAGVAIYGHSLLRPASLSEEVVVTALLVSTYIGLLVLLFPAHSEEKALLKSIPRSAARFLQTLR
jgi:O-antigen/teichoic acid export membrane protein